MQINLKFYLKLAGIIIFMLVILLIILSLLNKNIGKAIKITDTEMSFPKFVNGRSVRYYSSATKSIEEIVLESGQKKTLLRINAEKVFGVSWSQKGDKAIISTTTSDFSSDKNWLFSTGKNSLLPLDEKMSDFSWSQSDKIAYIFNGDELSINIADPDGSNKEMVYSLGENFGESDINLSWSNDNKNIAVSIGGTDVGPTEAFILKINTKDRTDLSQEPTGKVGLWSPDSKKLLIEIFEEWNSGYTWAIKNTINLNDKSLKLNTDGQIIWLSDSQTLITSDRKNVWKVNAQNGKKMNLYKPKPKEKLNIDLIIDYNENSKTLYFLSENSLYKVILKK